MIENYKIKLENIQKQKTELEKYHRDLSDQTKKIEVDIYTLQGAERMLLQLINEAESEKVESEESQSE